MWNGIECSEVYSSRASEGDVVTMELDLDAKTLSFGKNGVLGASAISNVVPGAYRLAVTVGLDAGLAVTIVE